MLKKIILLVLISLSTFAIEVKGNKAVYQYTIDVDVQDSKSNGSSWDVTGGAPDIFLRVNGSTIPFSENCRNTYKCIISFISDKRSFYIEVYDRDIVNHDLIGKGIVTMGRKYYLGKSKVTVYGRVK